MECCCMHVCRLEHLDAKEENMSSKSLRPLPQCDMSSLRTSPSRKINPNALRSIGGLSGRWGVLSCNSEWSRPELMLLLD
jgi:hypothetical protein